jgi:hypothetical protein
LALTGILKLVVLIHILSCCKHIESHRSPFYHP